MRAAAEAARYSHPIIDLCSRGLLIGQPWIVRRTTQLETLVSFRCAGSTPAPVLRGLFVQRVNGEPLAFLENMALEALRPNSEHAPPRWASLDVGTLSKGDLLTVELLDGHSAIGWSLVLNYRELIG